MGERVKKNGDTYFRAGGHYHRPEKLNYCVRDGNRCDLSGMVAKESPLRSSSEALIIWMVLFGKARVGLGGSVKTELRFEFEKLSGRMLFRITHLVPPLPLVWC